MGKRILLADDESALRFLISETLSDEGYEIVEAEDGASATEWLEGSAFDMAILDYMMPEKTGVEICSILREKEGPNRDIPVILLTAKAQEKDRETAKSAGVDAYIVKPFSPLQLMDAVEELLALHGKKG